LNTCDDGTIVDESYIIGVEGVKEPVGVVAIWELLYVLFEIE